MFNLELLDKNKQYSGVTFRDESKIFSPSWFIQLSGQKVAKQFGFRFKMFQIPTHSFALIFEEFDWWVYESHFETKGVHREKAWSWLADNKHKDGISFQLFEDVFNVDKLKAKIGCGYGTVDIGAFFIDFFKGSPSLLHKADAGLFCTEYISLCQVDSIIHCFPKIENHYELQPVHHLIAMQELKKISFGRIYL